MTPLAAALGGKQQEEDPRQRIHGSSVDCKLSEDRNLLCLVMLFVLSTE